MMLRGFAVFAVERRVVKSHDYRVISPAACFISLADTPIWSRRTSCNTSCYKMYGSQPRLRRANSLPQETLRCLSPSLARITAEGCPTEGSRQRSIRD